MAEKSVKELEDEYYKKNPGKRPLMRRLADNRKAQAKEKAKYNEIYREEFNKQRAASLKIRAKAEARAKYQPTRKQKMDGFVNALGNLGGAPITNKRKTQSKSKKKKTKKHTSNDPFDLGGLDNIGDFDF